MFGKKKLLQAMFTVYSSRETRQGACTLQVRQFNDMLPAHTMLTMLVPLMYEHQISTHITPIRELVIEAYTESVNFYFEDGLLPEPNRPAQGWANVGYLQATLFLGNRYFALINAKAKGMSPEAVSGMALNHAVPVVAEQLNEDDRRGMMFFLLFGLRFWEEFEFPTFPNRNDTWDFSHTKEMYELAKLKGWLTPEMLAKTLPQ